MSTPTKTKAFFESERTTKLGIPLLPSITSASPFGSFAIFKHLDNPADGELWADATNVYAQTGLTPSQLAEQRAELLEALKMLLDVTPADAPARGQIVGIEARHSAAIKAAYSAIKKATAQTKI